jgi:hypothetical protein
VPAARNCLLIVGATTNSGAKNKLKSIVAYFLNYLIYVLVEHTFPYLYFTAFSAFVWTLIIAEPKADAERKFKERRLKVRS